MAKIVAERMKSRTEITAYDPTVGSGGLLLNIGREVGKYIDRNFIHYYGQELITETANLAKEPIYAGRIGTEYLYKLREYSGG